METDPLSDFLKLADAQLTVSGGFTAGGAWAVRFPKPEYLKFFAVVKGRCWLHVEGDEEPVRMNEGDVVLLSAPQPFTMASDLAAPALDAKALFSGDAHNRTATLNDGGDFAQLGGHVRLDPTSGELVTQLLPPLIHVRAGTKQAARLEWLLEQIVQERAEWQPGATLVSNQLAQLLFVQTLRAWLDTTDALPCGWLRAATDRRLGAALGLMHDDPGRQWQLHELAKAAGMSRTSFAVHFKAVSGVPVLTYLTQWRMLLAQRALRTTDDTLSMLAGKLGYGSESAFSSAFKRVIGMSPAHYRNAWKAG
ncbi:AraC family transcriptional regulator [Paraburkholderia caballeronis]|uniref:AraC family transcriptional regulator n=1 Tax=Paraburkholderia caballeronis TaxID=416943 RepID=UPI0010659331|nr:AraC family transcriptional regulator [Paraburkholderia caballeronis]TDV37979.1 AraC family transcriptional regulator [Paraburkholderia caballeronis]